MSFKKLIKLRNFKNINYTMRSSPEHVYMYMYTMYKGLSCDVYMYMYLLVTATEPLFKQKKVFTIPLHIWGSGMILGFRHSRLSKMIMGNSIYTNQTKNGEE